MSLLKNYSFRRFWTRAFDRERDEKLSNECEMTGREGEGEVLVDDNGSSSSSGADDKYPSGEFVYREYDLLESLFVKLKTLVALPWERVKKGSVLTMKIRGKTSCIDEI
ncbi:hypothetical protein CDL12_30136 [Handroanthus impetiginosus]|uniref:Uncharacterized protein n=1 Tax=Handroanthus impetiginosus TaxID=429701 RepID=A0A2G9FWX8_9LAMI|nr:hypothetical protein CDL12_30136 [Handroanthus impetiginosus]